MLSRLNIMAQNKPVVQQLLASSVTVATRAGKIIKDVMSGGQLGIVSKGNDKNDLQTEADRSAQRLIVANLARQFPKITIIGEEGPTNDVNIPADWVIDSKDDEVLSKDCPSEYSSVNDEDIVVWVDPLDGTSEYTQGLLDHVTVLIGIAVKGKAVAGVIHQPYHNYKTISNPPGRTMWGLIGMGVGGFTPVDAPKDKLIITTTRSHSDGIVLKALEALKPDEVLKVGGAGHKVLMLMEGKAHAYVFASKGCKKWDTCAPEGVLEAMGGKLTDIYGDHYNYDKNISYPNVTGTFATGRNVDHLKLSSKIPQEVKDAFPKSQ